MRAVSRASAERVISSRRYWMPITSSSPTRCLSALGMRLAPRICPMSAPAVASVQSVS